MSAEDARIDLLVVGAGPTGIGIGAEARRAGLSVLLVDRGGLCAAIQQYPTYLEFFTTRDRLEMAGVPFTIPDVKPTRQQAIAYYRGVAQSFQIPLALYEDVRDVVQEDGGFAVHTMRRGGARVLRARRVAFATGYFDQPWKLGVPGEDLPWVHSRYFEPYPYFGEDVVIVGAGNTAAEAALDLWRNGARVTLVHRGTQVRPGVKYWLKPDIENRIAEGSIPVLFQSTVQEFRAAGTVVVRTPEGVRELSARAAFVFIGYRPDADLFRRAGVAIDPVSLIPTFDPATCETNVPGLYIAGTIQAGRHTDRIFIENSRDHGPRIVAHLQAQLAAEPALAAVR
ncbi:MAG TPA: YpdA family putative bacillithiol disulfide reductase [Thermoanaerobaculia bacterium]